jgi:hypothetical protein
MAQTSQIPALLVEGQVIDDDKEKAEAFNKTYLESSNLDDTGKTLPPAPNVGHDLLSEITVTHEDVNKALLHLKLDKAFGPDGISPRLLREARTSITDSLCRLLNMSLLLETFPAVWKRANVCPIYKRQRTTLHPTTDRFLYFQYCQKSLRGWCLNIFLTTSKTTS